jgi:uncharacterized protein
VKRIYLIQESSGFDWGESNLIKNWDKHKIAYWECEEMFFNKPLIVQEDADHSQTEKRYYALGKTDSNRRLFVAFTMRETLIRPISCRDMTRKEKALYEQYKKQ